MWSWSYRGAYDISLWDRHREVLVPPGHGGHEECIVPAEVRSYLSRFFSLLLRALICKVGKKGDLLHTVKMREGSFSNSLGTIPVT